MNIKPKKDRRTSHINTRWTLSEKKEIKRSAHLKGMDISEFIRWLWIRHQNDMNNTLLFIDGSELKK